MRKVVSGITLTLLLITMLTLAFNIQPVKASGTIYIRADGSVDPLTAPIQRDGDVYTFTDNIYDEIVVERSNIIIDGDGHTLQGSGSGYGFYLYGMNNVTIEKTNIKGFGFGIFLDSSSGNSMCGNNITGNNWDGIYIQNPSLGNSISGNNIAANNGVGVSLWNSSSGSISGNNIAYNGHGVYLGGAIYNTVSGNNITANSDCGMVLYSSSGNNISGNNVTANNYYGIRLYYFSSDNSISGNNIAANNYDGIHLVYFSSNNSISGNNVTANNNDGIWLYFSSDNSISGNNVTANNNDGILFDFSSNNSISGNNIASNYYGILLYYSPDNSISGNNVTANNNDGILLYYSPDNSISGNNIASNYYGIWLYLSSNNRVFHNNFINNLNQVVVYDSSNVWDDGYPSGGNYWSDYEERYPNAMELDDSGIWDTPYFIDVNNQDNYPLMNPWTPTPPAITATLDIAPDTLNLKSKGQWITAYMQLPEEYNAEDIDASTILLNETFQPVLDPKYDFVTNSSEYLVDHNGDGVLELMVKFNRTAVASWVYNDLGIEHGNIALTITGELFDGTPFEGTDTIKVLFPGDADDDGDVDSNDFYIFAGCYGMNIENPCYNSLADFNQDGYINSEDFYILSGNYGKTAR